MMIVQWLLCAWLSQAQAVPEALTQEEAVALTLTLQRQIIAAQLDVSEHEVDAAAARLWPNPAFSYSISNLVLGAGNDQERDLHPRFAEQRNQSVGIEQSIDVWRARWARVQAAKARTQVARWQLADVLREVVFATREAFVTAAFEQAELALAEQNVERWTQAVAVMAKRMDHGDIAQTDLSKFELEALEAHNRLLQARLELSQARLQLAERMGLPHVGHLPARLELPKPASAAVPTPEVLHAAAIARRPDVQATLAGCRSAEADQVVARREALPEVQVGVAYTRSLFQISGDNPHSLGFNVGVPLPVFDRNQPGRRRAVIARRAADNAHELLKQRVRYEVDQALEGLVRARAGLACYEGQGMLLQAARARDIARRGLTGGAFSLLEVLEAERTDLQTRGDHLAMQQALHQAEARLAYVTAQETP